jgi:hypothetical protein
MLTVVIGDHPHMPAILLGANVTVEVADEWTPLLDVKVGLVNAWAACQRQADIGRPELWRRSWWEWLFDLWQEDRIELAGRPFAALEAKPVLLNFPRDERVAHLFSAPGPHARLRYLPTGDRWFDVLVRAKQMARPEMIAPADAPLIPASDSRWETRFPPARGRYRHADCLLAIEILAQNNVVLPVSAAGLYGYLPMCAGWAGEWLRVDKARRLRLEHQPQFERAKVRLRDALKALLVANQRDAPQSV